jgi:autotransporter adhesin
VQTQGGYIQQLKSAVGTINGKLLQNSAQADGALATGGGNTGDYAGAIAIGQDATITQSTGQDENTTGAVAIGDGAHANADPGTAVGDGADAAGANSAAFGYDAQAYGQNSVALGAGSVANRANSVSVGNAATGLDRQITNVAPGTAPDDAATVGQLEGAMDQSRQYAAQIGTISAASIDAAASAAAAGGRQSLALGVGYMPSGGEGLAMSYRVRLSRHVSAIGTFSGNPGGGEVQAGAGVAWGW